MSDAYRRAFVLALVVIFAAGTNCSRAGSTPNDGGREVALDGNLLKAFLSANDCFVRSVDMPKHMKDLKNYDIKISEDTSHIGVLFYAKSSGKESDLFGGATDLGKDVLIKVDKKTFRVIDWTFFE